MAASALLSAGRAGLGDGYLWLGGVTLVTVSVLVTLLGLRTLIAVHRRQLCRPVEPLTAVPTLGIG